MARGVTFFLSHQQPARSASFWLSHAMLEDELRDSHFFTTKNPNVRHTACPLPQSTACGFCDQRSGGSRLPVHTFYFLTPMLTVVVGHPSPCSCSTHAWPPHEPCSCPLSLAHIHAQDASTPCLCHNHIVDMSCSCVFWNGGRQGEGTAAWPHPRDSANDPLWTRFGLDTWRLRITSRHPPTHKHCTTTRLTASRSFLFILFPAQGD